MQRAIVISEPGGTEVLLENANWPVPQPIAGDDVLIQVMAAGINRHDCNQRKAGPAHEPNPLPGLELAGIIVAVGRNVPQNRLGERVIALKHKMSVRELERPCANENTKAGCRFVVVLAGPVQAHPRVSRRLA